MCDRNFLSLDPPEFQTVIASNDESSNFHIGYFRDSPTEIPAFVASIGGKKGSPDYENPKFVMMGDNLFAALYLHIGKIINDADPFKMTALQKLKVKLRYLNLTNSPPSTYIHVILILGLRASPCYHEKSRPIFLLGCQNHWNERQRQA